MEFLGITMLFVENCQARSLELGPSRAVTRMALETQIQVGKCTMLIILKN